MIPSGPDLLRRILDSRLQEVHVAIPAQVQSFDAAAQTVSVQPMIKSVIDYETTELVESYPILQNVPVVYPRCGKYVVAFPLEAGDFVTILFNEWSIDHFLNKGTEVHPISYTRHGLEGAVAMPCGPYPGTKPVTETIDGLVVGYDGGTVLRITSDGIAKLGKSTDAHDFVALAALVKGELDKIVSAHNNHTHAVTGTTTASAANGAPLALAGGTTSATTTTYTSAPVAAAKVKAI
jgi:hypothetical protein